VPDREPQAFDHHSAEFARDWRAQYARLRAHCPVARTSAHGGYAVITRYADVRQVLLDPGGFACGRDLDFGDGPTGGVTVPANAVRMGMMEMDPPRSLAYRRLLAGPFSARAVRAYRPRLAEIVSWVVDRVIESGRIDFVDDVSNPLPALVSLDYLGLPLDRWQDWGTALHRAAYRERGSGRAVAAMLDDLRSVVAARRADAGERGDVVDLLLTAEVDGSSLPDEMVTELLFMLLNGGIDTSTALIAGTFGHLGAHPDHRATLAADPGLVPAAVDEMLRLLTPGTGVARTVAGPAEVGGVALHPGERVLLALGSANNDPDEFPDPDTARFDRPNTGRHLAFGTGVHRCLGAFLAPAEMTVLLDEVLRRMPDYRIDPAGVVPYPTIPLVNGYVAMPATFTPGPRMLAGFDDRLPVRRVKTARSTRRAPGR
jgi:cytochrome P450